MKDITKGLSKFAAEYRLVQKHKSLKNCDLLMDVIV